MKIFELDETDSTNEYCKRNFTGYSFAVTAKRIATQNGISIDGALNLSVVRRPYKMDLTEAFLITVNACTAVCRTLEGYGLKPIIQWPNNILVNGKRICAVKVENAFSGSFISRAIVGISLNVNNILNAELFKSVTTLKKETGGCVSVSEVRNMLLANMHKSFSLSDYKSYIDWFGKQVKIKTANGEQPATAVDVDADGRLICVFAGSLKKVNSVEVTLEL